MRHRNKTKTLDRKSGPRKALMRSLATNFVLYEKITTTKAKAKAVKPVVEKYVTLSKRNDLHARREMLKFFYTEGAVSKMLEVIGPRYKERPGGYTRIVPVGSRQGDGAEMVVLEFVK